MPKLKNEMDEKTTVAQTSKQGILQRLVATDIFYGSEQELYEAFMVTKRNWLEIGIESAKCWPAKVFFSFESKVPVPL